MAVVVSSLSGHKSFLTECQFQNPSFNFLKYNQKNQNHRSIFFFTRKGRSHLTLTVNGSSSDSDEIAPQDNEVNNVGVKAALSVLRFYKREISPILPKSCRYVPTCSEYSMQAYKKYGVVKGTILTTWRLCRCNPLGGSGFDPPRWFDEKRPPEV